MLSNLCVCSDVLSLSLYKMQGVLYVYPILWWQLYSMLLRQRKKKIGGAESAGGRTSGVSYKKRE